MAVRETSGQLTAPPYDERMTTFLGLLSKLLPRPWRSRHTAQWTRDLEAWERWECGFAAPDQVKLGLIDKAKRYLGAEEDKRS